ncbi:MAG TPA: amidohydrolase, partial [Aggregatilineales bacterium]|nr:amidohydrolase [Aggregatilineales bacterium]
MSTILIKNADIVTLDQDGMIHHDTDLLISEGRIAAISKNIDAQVEEVIDGSGRVVMPGLFNAHCHSPMTFERGWAEALPFPRWLNEKIWVAESALTSDDVYWGAMLAACEMIRSGTVAFNDHYFFMNRVAEVVAQSGLKANLTKCVFGIGAEKEIGGDLNAALEFIQMHKDLMPKRLKVSLGPHSPYVCPPEFLEQVVRLAREHKLPIHLHVSESKEQIENSKKNYGKTPVQQLHDLGALDGHVVAAHCLQLDEGYIEILAKKKVHVVRTPITYMKLAMPVNRIDSLQKAGITVALGTDGPGSNNDMDMFATIRQVALMEKYLCEDPEQLAGDLPLRMATQYGAQTMGFTDSGTIEVSAAADVIILDFRKPHLFPRHDLIANLVHSAKGSDVTHTIVGGKVLMRERRIITLDE